MSIYRYQVGKTTYDVFSSSLPKAKAYLVAVTQAKQPVFIGKDPVGNVDNVVAVLVPDDYMTPKQHLLKRLKEEYNAGEISLELYENDMRIIKSWK